MAYPSYITKSAIAYDLSGSASVAITAPDHEVNDILLVCAWNSAGATMSTATTGWAEITEVDDTQNCAWYWKRATATTGEGPTITASSTDCFAILYVFRGCITTGTPYEDATAAYNMTAETTPDTATITTTGSSRLGVCMLGIEGDSTWSSGNPPSGWSQKTLDVTSQGTDCGFNLMTYEKASAGDITAAVIGTYGESQEWASLTLALIPTPTTQAVTATAGTVATCTATLVYSTISIERKTGSGGTYAEINGGTTHWHEGTYQDNGPPFVNGTTYYYRARRMIGGTYGDYSDEVSVAYSGGTQTPVTLSATAGTTLVGPVRKTGRKLTATAATVATLARKVTAHRVLTVTAGTVATLKRAAKHALTVTSGTVASGTRKAKRTFTTSVATTATRVLKVRLPRTVTPGTTVSLRRISTRHLTVTTVAVATATRTRLKYVALTVTAGTTATIARVVNAHRVLTATSGTVPTLARKTARHVTATAVAVATITRHVEAHRVLTVTAGTVPTLKRVMKHTLTATVGTVASLFRKTKRAVTAQAGTVPSVALRLTMHRVLTVTVGSAVSISRTVRHTLSVAAATVASVVAVFVPKGANVTYKTLEVAAGTVASLSRKTGRRITTAAGAVASLSRQVTAHRTLTVTAGTLAYVYRRTGRRLTTTVTAVASVARRLTLHLTLTVTSGTIASLSRRTKRVLSAVPGTMVSIARTFSIHRTLTVTAGGVVSLSRRVTAHRTLTVAVGTVASLSRRFKHTLSVIVGALVSLSAEFVEIGGWWIFLPGARFTALAMTHRPMHRHTIAGRRR